MESRDTPAILLLEDGTSYRGYALGKIGTTTGEICFNTGMTGYQEIFTDPSYYGQILTATNVHIGNYGTADADEESRDVQIAGLVCKNFNIKYSRDLGDSSIQDYFERNDLSGICGVDTRAIVRHIRDKGAMNAIISSEELDLNKLKERLSHVPSMEGLELASKVTTPEAYELDTSGSNHRVAVMDYGVKQNILNCFIERGCQVRVFPAHTDIETVRAWNPDGYFLSNGPGDPAAMDYAVDSVKEMLKDNKPIFGICLGHQLLALSLGIKTYKMHNGHRGINHPVQNLASGQCEITSQNHGFGVSPEDIRAHEDIVEITHVNLNDDTIEGLRARNYPAMSVQYHPESSPGPHDSRYLFDDFIQLMKNQEN